MLVLFLPFQSLYLLYAKLTVLARASSIILNGNGESGHFCLFAELRGGACNILLSSIMYAVEHFLLFAVC